MEHAQIFVLRLKKNVKRSVGKPSSAGGNVQAGLLRFDFFTNNLHTHTDHITSDLSLPVKWCVWAIILIGHYCLTTSFHHDRIAMS